MCHKHMILGEEGELCSPAQTRASGPTCFGYKWRRDRCPHLSGRAKLGCVLATDETRMIVASRYIFHRRKRQLALHSFLPISREALEFRNPSSCHEFCR